MLELVAHVVKRLRCDSLHVEHVFGWHEAGGARADIRLSRAAGPLREHAYRLRKQATGERKVGQYSYLKVAGQSERGEIRSDCVHEVGAIQHFARGGAVLLRVGWRVIRCRLGVVVGPVCQRDQLALEVVSINAREFLGNAVEKLRACARATWR